MNKRDIDKFLETLSTKVANWWGGKMVMNLDRKDAFVSNLSKLLLDRLKGSYSDYKNSFFFIDLVLDYEAKGLLLDAVKLTFPEIGDENVLINKSKRLMYQEKIKFSIEYSADNPGVEFYKKFNVHSRISNIAVKYFDDYMLRDFNDYDFVVYTDLMAKAMADFWSKNLGIDDIPVIMKIFNFLEQKFRNDLLSLQNALSISLVYNLSILLDIFNKNLNEILPYLNIDKIPVNIKNTKLVVENRDVRNNPTNCLIYKDSITGVKPASFLPFN